MTVTVSRLYPIKTSRHLAEVVKSNIEAKCKSYYLITNEWDKACQTFNALLDTPLVEDQAQVNVINTFDVPNVLDTLRSAIKSNKETISTACLSDFANLPMLVVLHRSFPRVVGYNGSIAAELGV